MEPSKAASCNTVNRRKNWGNLDRLSKDSQVEKAIVDDDKNGSLFKGNGGMDRWF